MRRALVMAALAVGGCYSPTPAEGIACGTSDACPSGQHCDVDGRCRKAPLDAGAAPEVDALIDGSPISDEDGDGVTDDVDNCRTVPNAAQHDKDGDHVGDECDNCPMVENEDQASVADADDLGDACDPDATRMDTLVYFEGFYGPLSGWHTQMGWTVANEQLAGTASGQNVTFAYKDTAMPSNLLVFAHVALTNPATGGANVGIGFHSNTAGTQLYRCAVPSDKLDLTRIDGATQTVLDQADAVPDLNDLTIGVDVTGADVNCLVITNGVVTTVGATDPAPLTGDRAGPRVFSATGTFDYIAVYTH